MESGDRVAVTGVTMPNTTSAPMTRGTTGYGPVFESRAPGVSHLFLSRADAVGVIACPPTSTRSSAAIGARLNALSAIGVETASQWPRRPTMSAREAVH
jgi:hypothetical protein